LNGSRLNQKALDGGTDGRRGEALTTDNGRLSIDQAQHEAQSVPLMLLRPEGEVRLRWTRRQAKSRLA
jgi:hypothetical protein